MPPNIDSFIKSLKLWEKAKITKRKIVVKAGKDSDVKVYINENYNFLPLDKDVKQHSDALFDEGMEFYRDDLIEDEIEREAELSKEEILCRLEKILTIEDYKILKSSFNILYYDKKEESGKAVKYYKTHMEKYKERGKKIYNLAESPFFDLLFFPFLDELESTYKDKTLEIQQTFQEFFNDLLKFNPIAIWVNNLNTIEDIQVAMMGRLIIRNQPYMYIFGRTKKNIEKIRKAILTFRNEYEEYNFYEKDRKIRKLRACEFFVYNTEKPTTPF